MLRALDLLGQMERDQLRTPTRSSSLLRSNDRSPYFTPPPTGPVTRSKSFSTPSRQSLARYAQLQGSKSPVVTRAHGLPPTPKSPTPKAKRSGGVKRAKVEKVGKVGRADKVDKGDKADKAGKAVKGKRKARDIPVTAKAERPITSVRAPDENGHIDQIGKIHLIQERVRHDPWKMLVATCLLNVTSGRAALPIYVELLHRYPNPHALSEASIPDLSTLLYPLGLFNQRASTLVRFSQQYITRGWPLHPGTESSNPHIHPTHAVEYSDIPTELDVTVFAGAGRYASDSFRIYSDLLDGRGGPEREGRWVEKRKRALGRMRERKGRIGGEGGEGLVGKGEEDGGEEEAQRVEENGEDAGGHVLEMNGYLSDEEDVGEEEWRRVRPTDKELKRYLIWRWGLEGILYDDRRGPQIRTERDRLRLAWLMPRGADPDSDA